MSLIDLFENRLKLGQELSEEELEEIDRMRATETENKELSARLVDIIGLNLRVRVSNYIEALKETYDKIELEYQNPNTSDKRKVELAVLGQKVSEGLNILTR
ncbi:MAG: hypothetical protein AAB451_00430 [Patescibacteria group bacterium]